MKNQPKLTMPFTIGEWAAIHEAVVSAYEVVNNLNENRRTTRRAEILRGVVNQIRSNIAGGSQ